MTNKNWFEIRQNKEIKHEIICELSSGFIQSTMIYIPIFLCGSGIGKHLKVSKTNNTNGAVDLQLASTKEE